MITRGNRVGWTRLALGLSAAVAALAVFGAACGGGGGGDQAKAEVEAAIRAFVAAYNDKDAEGFLALATDKWIETQIGGTREEVAAEVGEFIGEPPITIEEISSVQVTDDTATAEVTSSEGNVRSALRGGLVRQDGAWLIDSEEDLPVEIPAGVTAVDMTLSEYQFTFDADAITSGNIAFDVSNAGGEQHVIDLAKVPEDFDIEQALQSEEEPPGIEEIGAIDPLDPGSGTTMVFTEALAPGRYVMVCFIEAPDGEPHALKGMWAEFTVQ